ncbi:MAG: hypothetical protein ACOX4U_00455 [Anaerovoracaceae bacterium]|jgi:hypothetical protein
MMSLKAGGITIDGLKLWRERHVIPHLGIEEQNIRMSDGTMVTEVKYQKWVIECDFDYLRDEVLKELIPILRKDSFPVQFVPPDTNSPVTANFHCTVKPRPIIREWDFGTKPPSPMWAEIVFTLEEV